MNGIEWVARPRLSLLTESRLSVHTRPEFGSLRVNLRCCFSRREWDFDAACG
jgi:hypothetical protein